MVQLEREARRFAAASPKSSAIEPADRSPSTTATVTNAVTRVTAIVLTPWLAYACRRTAVPVSRETPRDWLNAWDRNAVTSACRGGTHHAAAGRRRPERQDFDPAEKQKARGW